jgi:dynein intermediate chain
LTFKWQETLELTHTGHNKTVEVAITTLDFPDNETTTFLVGTEEGNVYQANRYDRAGAKAGLNQYDIYKGHSGPVMGLHFHPLVGPVDFSDLFLTCSVDWTVKLWRAKSISKPSSSPHTVNPLYSFDEADDYVYDVKWHPAHPAVFGTVDGSGKFDLWNLNSDTEVSWCPFYLFLIFVHRLILSGPCSINYSRIGSRHQQNAMGQEGRSTGRHGRQ